MIASGNRALCLDDEGVLAWIEMSPDALKQLWTHEVGGYTWGFPCAEEERFYYRDGERIPVAPIPSFPVHDWLDEHSALYALVFQALTRVPQLRDRWEESGLIYAPIALFYDQQVTVLQKEFDNDWKWRCRT